jgi:hypothetical protein
LVISYSCRSELHSLSDGADYGTRGGASSRAFSAIDDSTNPGSDSGALNRTPCTPGISRRCNCQCNNRGYQQTCDKKPDLNIEHFLSSHG